MELVSNQSSSRRGRSTRACQACRLAKARCDPIPDESHCRRCSATSSPCHFLSSRRGRIKGSKNRRTIERLAEIQDESASPSSDHIVAASPYDQDGSQSHIGRESETDKTRLGNSGAVSRAATPWNPQNIFINDDNSHGTTRPPLGRRLQNIMGEFPIEHGKRRDKATEPKETQEPLWRITGLCERNWDLQGKDKNVTNCSNSWVLQDSILPGEDQELLARWTPRALQDIQREQAESYRHGMFGSKRDVSRVLDPIHHGLLSEDRAQELLKVYWESHHPQWPILDPDLHTLDRVRSRSALLTTVMLALASTTLSVKPGERVETVTEALRLHAHVEKLNLVVFATAAKSVDIVQAQILLSRWGTCPKSRLDEQRWMRVAMIPRMAAEIGLHLPGKYDDARALDPEEIDMMRLNDIRTRAFMIISEHRFYTFSGRPPMDTSQFELTSEEMKDKLLPTSLAASYNLLLFDRDARRRIDQCQPGAGTALSLDSETDYIKSHLERWIDTWCRQSDSTLNWHLKHEALGCCLLLVVRIAKKRLELCGSAWTASGRCRQEKKEQQQLLLELCTRIFETILTQPRHVICTTHRASIIPFAGSIVLKLTTQRDVLLRVALRMAGEPGRPFVPSHVREAGIQLLLLLEMNSLSHVTTQEDDAAQVESTAVDNDASQRQFPPNTPIQDDNMHTTYNTYDPTISTASQIMGLESMFMFDTSDLPCIPNPSQPQYEHPLPMFACVPNDLDAWLGSTSPATLGDMGEPVAMGNVQQCNLPPMEPSISSHPHLHVSMASETSQMCGALEGDTPGSTAFAPSTATGNTQQRNPQKEVLLATVSWLSQIASLM